MKLILKIWNNQTVMYVIYVWEFCKPCPADIWKIINHVNLQIVFERQKENLCEAGTCNHCTANDTEVNMFHKGLWYCNRLLEMWNSGALFCGMFLENINILRTKQTCRIFSKNFFKAYRKTKKKDINWRDICKRILGTYMTKQWRNIQTRNQQLQVHAS